MSNPSANLTCDNVTFGYEPGTPVLQRFTAQLKPGRICALIGPNAAGKTTLLRLLLGQLAPWSGNIRLGDRDVRRMEARGRAALMSYVPQHGSVSFAFTVEQVVLMGRYALTADAEAVAQALEACDLTPLRQRVFGTLSAGQQQRVLLARALVQSTGRGQVMLLDEPVSALDLWHVHQTMGRLRQCATRGLAVLVVLHDLNLAARYADDVWLVHEGRMAAAGEWRAVLTPAVLEPIYRVGMRVLTPDDHGRPVFIVDPPDTLLTGAPGVNPARASA